jgi:hypothetical protein
MSVIAAIQYALFKNPNSPVFGGTDAARCTAAIRLPNNHGWADKGWWAETWSDWSFASPTAAAIPGGSIQYIAGTGFEVWGGDYTGGGGRNDVNGRSSIRDNGNRTAPFSNLPGIREPQLYGTLMECRVRVPSTSTECLYFLGLARGHATTITLDGYERIFGVVATAGTNSWRAVVMRNNSPSDGITPAVITKDTSLSLTASTFTNFVMEISGGGESARWRASTGAWTNNKIPVVATASKAELHSRPREGNVVWGAETRETAAVPATPGYMRVTRMSVHAWRPGFVATRPVFRKN